jgi:hypothetical protein
MAVLGAVSYDPASAVTKATDTLLAMTAVDTTNLRLTFNAPANGNVLVRIKCQTHGATSPPRLLLGVLDGSTVRGRMSPMGAITGSNLATTQFGQEVSYVITGLTPTTSYSFDAAYGVEIVVASSAIKYGGPNNTTTDDAYGAFQFEVWETANLLAGTLYDPTSAVTKATTSLLAMTALDTTNLRLTFNAPASGNVYWRVSTQQHGSTTVGQMALGILDGSTVKARTAPISSALQAGGAVGSSALIQEASGVITGLTPTQSYTWDAAYGVEIVAAGGGLKYGGANDTTTNNAFGGTAFEIWTA